MLCEKHLLLSYLPIYPHPPQTGTLWNTYGRIFCSRNMRASHAHTRQSFQTRPHLPTNLPAYLHTWTYLAACQTTLGVITQNSLQPSALQFCNQFCNFCVVCWCTAVLLIYGKWSLTFWVKARCQREKCIVSPMKSLGLKRLTLVSMCRQYNNLLIYTAYISNCIAWST